MSSAGRKNRSFSLDPDLLDAIERTKGSDSASERVNQLLRCALETEHRARVDQEIVEFFSDVPDDREARQAFQAAGLKTWARE